MNAYWVPLSDLGRGEWSYRSGSNLSRIDQIKMSISTQTQTNIFVYFVKPVEVRIQSGILSPR